MVFQVILKLTYSYSKGSMDFLVKDSLLNLPDEVIEYIMSFLSFADLSKLSEAGKRLEDCAKRASKMKPFRKYSVQLSICHRID